MSAPRVTGFCPMGCGGTLFLGAANRVTCSYVDCPNPSAVDELLDDRQTEHIVELGVETFTVRHPLRERLGDQLMDCDVHNRIAALDGPPATPGRYRVAIAEDGTWSWQTWPTSGGAR